MTETQYLLGWMIYLTGGTGCLLALWFMVRIWNTRFKRFLMALFAVLIYLPGITRPDMDFLAPAFLITLFDGLTYGPEGMLRTGKAVALFAGIASLIALLLPVKKQTTRKKPSSSRASSDSSSDKKAQNNRRRKEPVY